MGHAQNKAKYLRGGYRSRKVRPHGRQPFRSRRPTNYLARMFNGTVVPVESTQTGRGKPSTHSKRMKGKR